MMNNGKRIPPPTIGIDPAKPGNDKTVHTIVYMDEVTEITPEQYAYLLSRQKRKELLVSKDNPTPRIIIR